MNAQIDPNAQKDFESFFNKDLMPHLTSLEEQRKLIVRRLRNGALITLAITLVVWAIVQCPPQFILIPAAIIFLILYLAWIWPKQKVFKKEFKEKVIAEIIKFIDAGMSYRHAQCISKKVFKESEIYKHRIDKYNGDDLVFGTIDKTNIAFSELHAQYKTTDSKGRTSWHTIFKGLFFQADFNKYFQGKTFVLPDNAERLLGGFGKWLQSANFSRPDLIKLEDPDFEKEFCVYSDDQVEARYILSTSLMQRILNFRQKTGRRVSLSFVNNKVFVAVQYNRNLFEPKIFGSLVDPGKTREYFDDIDLFLGIVEDLNLNLRIWTKQ